MKSYQLEITHYGSPCQRELARVGVGWRGGGCSIHAVSQMLGDKIESCLFLIGQRALLRDRGCWKEEADQTPVGSAAVADVAECGKGNQRRSKRLQHEIIGVTLRRVH